MPKLILGFVLKEFAQHGPEQTKRFSGLIRVPDDRPPFGGQIFVERACQIPLGQDYLPFPLDAFERLAFLPYSTSAD